MNKEYTIQSKIFGIFKQPEETFKNISEKDLRYASLIILVSILLSSWAGVVYRSKIPTGVLFQRPLLAQMDQDLIRQNMIILGAVRETLSTLLAWILPTLIIHLITQAFDGSGSLKRFFTMIGFSYIPMIIQNFLRVIDAYTISPLQAGYLITVNPGSGIAGIISQFLNIYTIFRVASISISSHAISVNYQLDRTRSLGMAFISYMIFLLPALF
ncbi:MAG: Yip1 family protein [Candidatus Bathyarchaeia archaeon]